MAHAPEPGGGAAGGGVAGPEASPADRWDALQVTGAAARAARASKALAARGPEDGVDPSRPVPPALPRDAWALIMDCTASCRCAAPLEGGVILLYSCLAFLKRPPLYSVPPFYRRRLTLSLPTAPNCPYELFPCHAMATF